MQIFNTTASVLIVKVVVIIGLIFIAINSLTLSHLEAFP